MTCASLTLIIMCISICLCATLQMICITSWQQELELKVGAVLWLQTAQFVLSGATGALAVVAVAVVRIYLGWAYVGNRLLSAAVDYEETGWCAVLHAGWGPWRVQMRSAVSCLGKSGDQHACSVAVGQEVGCIAHAS